MRLHRMRLRNFRGITDREVRFADRGVTIVEGANEAGKSSMIEALGLLLDTRADSKSAKVRDVMPSGQDVGSEVEVEMTCGPWHFTYAKRFNRQVATTLTIAAPRPEQLSGRDAHERVVEILGSHADLALFRALQLLQSGDPALASVAESAALARALDRAADSEGRDREGQESDGQGSDAALVDDVTAEYRRYRTLGQGRPTGELAQAIQAAEEASRRHDQLTRARDAVEADAQRLGELDSRRKELDRTRELREVERDELAVTWQKVEKLQGELGAAEAEVRHLLTASQLARRDVIERERLGAEITSLTEQARGLADDIAGHAARAASAAQDASDLDAELSGARERWAQVRAELAASEAARRILRTRRELRDLDERLGHLADIVSERDALQNALDANTVDRAAVEAAAGLGRRHTVARARVEAAAARFTVEPTGSVPVRVDGVRIDAESDHVAVDDAVIEVDGIVRVTVRRSSGTEQPIRELSRIEAEIADFCDRHRLGSLDDHVGRAQERVELTHRLASLRQRLADLTQGRDLAELSARRTELRRIIESADPVAGDDGVVRDVESLASTEREVGELVMAAERAVAQKRSVEADAGTRASMARQEHARIDARLTELGGRREQLADECSLGEARRVVDAAEQRLAQARERVARLDTELARLDVAEIEMRRARVAADLAAIARERADAERSATELRTRVELYREESRLDDLHDAATQLDAATAALARVTRRADAAELLYRTLIDARQDARTRYADPYARRLEELGSHVFGDDVRFDVDDSLEVVSRTLGGITVQRDALSGGAREQLGLLTRLACATLVDEDDGVPVLVDDALGYSDPQRLTAMGGVLAAAGEDAQVIVLTCSPDRYRGVDGATVVAV